VLDQQLEQSCQQLLSSSLTPCRHLILLPLAWSQHPAETSRAGWVFPLPPTQARTLGWYLSSQSQSQSQSQATSFSTLPCNLWRQMLSLLQMLQALQALHSAGFLTEIIHPDRVYTTPSLTLCHLLPILAQPWQQSTATAAGQGQVSALRCGAIDLSWMLSRQTTQLPKPLPAPTNSLEKLAALAECEKWSLIQYMQHLSQLLEEQCRSSEEAVT